MNSSATVVATPFTVLSTNNIIFDGWRTTKITAGGRIGPGDRVCVIITPNQEEPGVPGSPFFVLDVIPTNSLGLVTFHTIDANHTMVLLRVPVERTRMDLTLIRKHVGSYFVLKHGMCIPALLEFERADEVEELASVSSVSSTDSYDSDSYDSQEGEDLDLVDPPPNTSSLEDFPQALIAGEDQDDPVPAYSPPFASVPTYPAPAYDESGGDISHHGFSLTDEQISHIQEGTLT